MEKVAEAATEVPEDVIVQEEYIDADPEMVIEEIEPCLFWTRPLKKIFINVQNSDIIMYIERKEELQCQ